MQCDLLYTINIYRPQTKFAKVMLLHLSVILFTGGCLGPGPRGRLGGGLLGGCPGEFGGLPGGGVQAQARGDVSQHALRQTPPTSRRLLLRTVRILLECILVNYVTTP